MRGSLEKQEYIDEMVVPVVWRRSRVKGPLFCLKPSSDK